MLTETVAHIPDGPEPLPSLFSLPLRQALWIRKPERFLYKAEAVVRQVLQAGIGDFSRGLL